MDPVSNIDQLVLILRRRLMERSTASERMERKAPAREGSPGGLQSVYALAKIDGVDDRKLGRALIQSILADQFGAGMINEAKFQQVVDRVFETLEMDETTSKLLSTILKDLRAVA